MIVKKRCGIAPSWSPRATLAKSAQDGVLVGANVERKKNGKTEFLREK